MTPLIDSYEQIAPQMVRRTQMDAGPDKVGRRYTANVSKLTCRYVFTKDELVLFDDFYFGPAAGGSVAIEWTHPWRGGTVRMRIVEPPRYTNAGHPQDTWVVALTLEILPPGMPA